MSESKLFFLQGMFSLILRVIWVQSNYKIRNHSQMVFWDACAICGSSICLWIWIFVHKWSTDVQSPRVLIQHVFSRHSHCRFHTNNFLRYIQKICMCAWTWSALKDHFFSLIHTSIDHMDMQFLHEHLEHGFSVLGLFLLNIHIACRKGENVVSSLDKYFCQNIDTNESCTYISPLAQGEISLCVCFTTHVW